MDNSNPVTRRPKSQLYALIRDSTYMVDMDFLNSTHSNAAAESLGGRLSKNIAIRRKELGLTQAQLAEKLGVETETLSRFERGKNLPSLATLEKLANLLLVSVADLLAEQPKVANDEALVITSWLGGLCPADKQFVFDVMKQCCDYIQSKKPS